MGTSNCKDAPGCKGCRPVANGWRDRIVRRVAGRDEPPAVGPSQHVVPAGPQETLLVKTNGGGASVGCCQESCGGRCTCGPPGSDTSTAADHETCAGRMWVRMESGARRKNQK